MGGGAHTRSCRWQNAVAAASALPGAGRRGPAGLFFFFHLLCVCQWSVSCLFASPPRHFPSRPSSLPFQPTLLRIARTHAHTQPHTHTPYHLSSSLSGRSNGAGLARRSGTNALCRSLALSPSIGGTVRCRVDRSCFPIILRALNVIESERQRGRGEKEKPPFHQVSRPVSLVSLPPLSLYIASIPFCGALLHTHLHTHTHTHTHIHTYLRRRFALARKGGLHPCLGPRQSDVFR